MSRSDRWQRVDRLFLEALSLSPEHREQRLTREASEDPATAREARELLAAADQAAGFLETPAAERLARRLAVDGWWLRPGDHVGHYQIVEMLGAGGNGEVWRARDERLQRDVAIKMLLPHVSADPRQLPRFIEEARTAGGLNHANLVTIHDVGEHQGVPYLVSECLDGTSLRQRMSAGPLRVEDAVAIALGIAAGLRAAHQRGIVHCDLKPENVFLRSEGGVKILDFGLARLQAAAGEHDDGTPTAGSAMAGTAAYMSPEQIRGDQPDARSDLFALGIMLHEMLAHEHPFRQDSTFATLRAILEDDPRELTSRPRPVPASLSRIVRRLLEKHPAARFQSAADLAWALEQSAVSNIDANAAPIRDTTAWPARPWLWALAGAMAAAAVAIAWKPTTTPADAPAGPALTRFSWTLPDGVGLGSAPVVSPDSRYVAFVGIDGAQARLYVRALGDFDAHAVPGSEGARQPFWSPDSQWLAFFSRGRLMKVTVAGGSPVTVVEAPRTMAVGTRRTEQGGTWSSRGQIVYGAGYGDPVLLRVDANGGPITAVTALTPGQDARHRFPSFLPDGTHLLFFAGTETEDRRGVYLADTEAPTQTPGRRLLQSESDAVYVPWPPSDRGALLFLAQGRLQVQRFEPNRREAIGPAQPLPIEVGGSTVYDAPLFGASPDVLAYSPSPIVVGDRISAINEDGSGLTVVNEREMQQWPRVSPDGHALAWLRIDPVSTNPDIWVEDLVRHTRVRVTTSIGRDLMHVWSPDGTRLAYRPEFAEPRRLDIVSADGSGATETLTCPRAYCEPTGWTSDGRSLVVNVYEGANVDVWSVGAVAGVASRPLLAEPFTERDARLSPNGRWIAYVSDETGRPQVSIRSLDQGPRRYVISADGGSQPVWHPEGHALYFVDAAGMLRKVAIQESRDGLTTGSLTALKVPRIGAGHSNTQYDVTADGRIYFLDQSVVSARPTELRVVVGWRSLLPAPGGR